MSCFFMQINVQHMFKMSTFDRYAFFECARHWARDALILRCSLLC